MSNRIFVSDWFDYAEGERDRLRWREGNLEAETDVIYSYGHHFPLAVKCLNGYVLNGDRYSHSTAGHQSDVRGEVNRRGLKFVEIPMTVLYEVSKRRIFSSLDIARRVKIVFNREASYREIEYVDDKGEKKTRTEHLLGGCVIEIEGSYFISGTDDGAPWGRGYFLTELKGKPRNYAHAFSLLVPEFVKRAKKSGKEVLRQGEWFFVEAGYTDKLKKKFKIKSKLNTVKMELLPVQVSPEGQASRQPHHRVTEAVYDFGGSYVRGYVRHTGGDHKRLKLGDGVKWYQAVHNLQVMSWSARGRRVD